MLRNVLACFALLASTAGTWADAAGDCSDRIPDLERQIEACSEIIVKGQLHKEALAKAHLRRGWAYSTKLRRDDLAMADYTKAIELNPRLTDAHIFRGHLYAAMGQDDRAVGDYTRALELAQDPGVYANRADIYRRQGRYQQAIADHNKVAELLPDCGLCYFARGRTHEEYGDKQQAIADYRKALARRDLPSIREALKRLGERS